MPPVSSRRMRISTPETRSGFNGETRGSGVMRLTDDGWKIEQYVLSFAVPNAAADAVVEAIKVSKAGQAAD